MNISYIITTYNKKNLLKKALEERISRLKDGDELIVLDDGSNDGTREMIKDYPVRYHRIKNKGYRIATLRNKGIELAKNDCIIQCDDDVLFPDGYVEMLLEHYDEKTLVSGAFKRKTKDGLLEEDWRDSRNFKEIDDNIYELKDGGYGGAVCYNRQFAQKIGGYDEDFNGNWGGEDTNFGERWYHNGGRCLYINKLYATHLYHKRIPNRLEQQRHNLKILYKKLDDIKENDKFAILIHTFLRDNLVKKCVQSIKKHLNNYRIYISDAGFITKEKNEWYNKLKEEGHVIIQRPYDSTWPSGRDALTKEVEEDYVLYLDDDYVVTDKTDVSELMRILKAYDDICLVGGEVLKNGKPTQYMFSVVGEPGDMTYEPIETDKDIYYCDVMPNFWLGKRETFDDGVGWDKDLNIGGGHSDFFLNIKFNTDWNCLYTNRCSIDHEHIRNKKNNKYFHKRRRDFWNKKFLKKWNNGVDPR